MTFSVSSLYQWPRHSTPKTREMVLGVIRSSKTPLATKDIYKATVKPNADEQIRSMRYLKTVVLRDLAAHNHIEKVRIRGAFTAWLWRPKQAPAPVPAPANQSKLNPRLLSPISGSTALTPAAVGVGEDWSHLNKRRQRARKMKVGKDLQRLLDVQKTRVKAELQS